MSRQKFTLHKLAEPLDDWTGAQLIIRSNDSPGGVALFIGGEEEYAPLVLDALNAAQMPSVAEAPDGVRELELYAWVGEDELGSGEVGLKQGLAPAGMIPMVAIRRDKVEQFALRFEAQAWRYGKRIYLVRFKAVEVVRVTEAGE